MCSQKAFIFTLILLACVGLSGCEPELIQEEIPYIPFPDVVINLTLPEYQILNTNGGYKYINEGVRGIIIYRQNSGSYQAFEQTCSFDPNSAGATVSVDPSGLFMKDPNCGSLFSFADGQPTGGPASFPLRRYRTFVSGTTLTITDDPLN